MVLNISKDPVFVPSQLCNWLNVSDLTTVKSWLKGLPNALKCVLENCHANLKKKKKEEPLPCFFVLFFLGLYTSLCMSPVLSWNHLSASRCFSLHSLPPFLFSLFSPSYQMWIFELLALIPQALCDFLFQHLGKNAEKFI